MKPIFSIIIPHNNIPTLLTRCLNTIPDREDIQVIVVDDNSSPNIVDFRTFPGIDRKYTEIIFSKAGKGAGYARNIGIKHAVGKWLIFADADDFFVENFCHFIYNYKDSNAQIVLFKALSVNSRTYEPSFRHLTLNEDIDKAIKGKITPQEASIHMPTPWCRLFDRNFIVEKNISYDEIMFSNDVMFVTKATCWAERVIVDPNPIYVVTLREGSLANTKKDEENYLCRFRVSIKKNKFLTDYPYPKSFVFEYIIRAIHVKYSTPFKALLIAIKEHAVTSGFSSFIETIKRKLRISPQ